LRPKKKGRREKEEDRKISKSKTRKPDEKNLIEKAGTARLFY